MQLRCVGYTEAHTCLSVCRRVVHERMARLLKSMAAQASVRVATSSEQSCAQPQAQHQLRLRHRHKQCQPTVGTNECVTVPNCRAVLRTGQPGSMQERQRRQTGHLTHCALLPRQHPT